MGQFNGMTLTNQGLALQIKTIADGKPLNITRVVLGKGNLPAGADIRSVTALADPVMELPIISKKVTGDGTATVKALVSNEGVTDPFYTREIGLFADGGDGEVLYSYSYAGDNCDYIPAAGGATVINYIWTLYIIVDRISEIVAKVDSGLAFATQDELQEHINDANAHPNLPHIGDTFGTDVDQSAVKYFWVDNGDGKLHKAAVDLTQKAVLGNDWANIKTYNNRLTQLEREQANILLNRELWAIYPDLNFAIAEDFVSQDTIDKFACNVTSVVAGDDSIDTDSLQGIVPGAYYTISDGVQQEVVQIKSCTKSAGIYRIILAKPITNTYMISNTTMYRTTSQVTIGQAAGSGSKKNAVWSPTLVWRGVNASTEIILEMGTTMDNKDNFTIDGDISFTADGAVTLV